MQTSRVQIFIKKDSLCDWEKMKRICKRDGVSLSSKLDQLVRDYTGIHSDGNAQTVLDFAEKPLCLPKYKTCVHSNRILSYGTFHCRKEHVRKIPKACDRCKSYRTVKRED